MKRLYIVRHGKSSWDLESIRDIDRPLKEKGINDAYKMARQVAAKEPKPQLIISSNAIRALHSAVIIHRELKLAPEVLTISVELYHADVDEILQVIYTVDDNIDFLMIFGHNPGFTELANYLSNLNIMNVPTTGMVILDFEVSKWNEIDRNSIAKERFEYPRNL